MGVFNTWALGLLAGAAVPIIIHLLHRQKYRRVRWAAMEFLLAAIRRTRRRLQLENLLLLLVRIFIMVAVALAIARPFFREAPVEALADTDVHHIFVIDTSYSMGYKKAQETCLDLAKKAAEEKLDSLRRITEQDKISVILMSSQPEEYVRESNKRDDVKRDIAKIRLSHFGTSAPFTFAKIKEAMDRSRNAQKRVYLFTDFQRIAWDAGDEADQRKFAEFAKALSSNRNVQFHLIDVGTDGADNRAVVDVRSDDAVVTIRKSARFTAELHNFSTANYPSVAVNIHVDGSLYRTEHVALSAGSGAAVTFAYDFVEPGPHSVEVAAEPDFLGVDDRRHLVVEVRDGLRGLLVEGETGTGDFGSEVDYLAFLLNSGGGRTFKIERTTPEMFDAERLDRYDFVALCNVQSLEARKVENLERFVQGGGGLFVSVGDKVDRRWYNETLFRESKGLLPAELVEVAGSPPGQEPRIPVRIQNYRGGHRIFSTFMKGREKAPRELIFYQYFRLEKVAPEEVVAELDDPFATPLFIDRPFGEGRVVLFNSTVDDEWNLNVPGRIPYGVLMWNASEHLAVRPAARHNLFIGDVLALPLPAEKSRDKFFLETPDEGRVPISPGPPEAGSRTFWIRYKPPLSEGLVTPGRYVLDYPSRPEGERPLAYFAVNLLPRAPAAEELARAEGNLDRISEDDLRRLVPGFKFDVVGRKGSSEKVDLAAPASGLWRYLLYLLVGLLGLEGTLAMLFGRVKR